MSRKTRFDGRSAGNRQPTRSSPAAGVLTTGGFFVHFCYQLPRGGYFAVLQRRPFRPIVTTSNHNLARRICRALNAIGANL